jgi:tRNA threonylcarbamoyladenosine modification (KEOPS) complex  Pcc1 subunit
LRGRMPEKLSPRVRCTLTLEFESRNEAEKVHRSVELDNLGYLESTVRENLIIADMEADSLKSLLHTLEDFLACTSVASKIVSKKN